MRFVNMSKFGKGNGDCLTACVASLLDCEIDEIPDFSAMGARWHVELTEYLRRKNIGTIYIREHVIHDIIGSLAVVIAIFETDDPEEMHAILGNWESKYVEEKNVWQFEFTPIFDPNPKGTVLVKIGSILMLTKVVS